MLFVNLIQRFLTFLLHMIFCVFDFQDHSDIRLIDTHCDIAEAVSCFLVGSDRPAGFAAEYAQQNAVIEVFFCGTAYKGIAYADGFFIY